MLLENSMLKLRVAYKQDIPKLQEIYFNAIHFVCNKHYTTKQLQAWSDEAKDYDTWQQILQEQYVLVAENEGTIVGFGSLQNTNHIHLLYVHFLHQRKGIAKAIYVAFQKLAADKKVNSLTVEASITARPFFQKMGFVLKQQQEVYRQTTSFINYKMEKQVTYFNNATPKDSLLRLLFL